MAKKVAVLDLGTNSFHLLLARIDTEWERVEMDRQRPGVCFSRGGDGGDAAAGIFRGEDGRR